MKIKQDSYAIVCQLAMALNRDRQNEDSNISTDQQFLKSVLFNKLKNQYPVISWKAKIAGLELRKKNNIC